MTTLTRAALIALLVAAPLPVFAADDEEPPAPAWTFSHEDGVTMLLFGVPAEWEGSPNYLSCKDHSGKVEVEVWADHQVNPNDEGGQETTRITVRSGPVEKVFQAQAQDEEMNGGAEVTATLAADEPVLAQFARTGVIKLTAYGASTDMPPAKVADAAKLLQACRKAH